MAISRTKKDEVVKELNEALDSAKIVVFTDFKGMDVNSLTNLRNKVRESGGRYLVAKKTLIKRVLDEKKIKDLNPLEMEGQIGIAFGTTDSVSTSKVVYQTQKEGKILRILGGIMDPSNSLEQFQILSDNEIIELAQLPTREELLAQVVGSIKAPISGFVNVLRGNLTGLVYALKAIQNNKG